MARFRIKNCHRQLIALVNLIPRFYDVSAGAVTIDGIGIRKVSLASLRRQIAIVTQEPILFNHTVLQALSNSIQRRCGP